MAEKAEQIRTLFIELQRFYQRGEHEKALKAANKILQEEAGNETAFHCKIVCQIQLGKFEDALVQVRKNGELSSGLGFEKAYCEYRLNRINEALKTLTSLEEQNTAANELLAQVLYRVEDFSECYNLYRDQLKNLNDDFDAERKANLSAVLAALQNWGSPDSRNFELDREEAYEVCYNYACFLIGQGQHKEALEALRQAEKMCVDFFADDPDATEEDIDVELSNIRAQQGYVLQLLGKNDEASKLYNLVMKQKPSDVALVAVISNNIVSINKDQNVFDSKKKIKSATVAGLQHKLVTKQRETIANNQCLLHMYTNQGEQCRLMAGKLQKEQPDSDVPCLIAAAQHVKDKQLDQAIALLQTQLSASRTEATVLRLTLAQLYLHQGHVDKACELLKSLPESMRNTPGLVSALVSLYVNEEDTQNASQVLNQALTWHTQRNANSPELVQLMKETVNFEMTHGDPHKATTLLETLRKKDPSDMKVLAQLIAAYSRFDAQKAQQLSRQRLSPAELTRDMDSAALEASVTSFVPKYIKKSAAQAGSAAGQQSPASPRSGGGDEPLKKHPKKKKGKLPKNAEPGAVPDPERWMPLRERSTYKGRRRKNRQQRDVGRGTQGASASYEKLMAELDISSRSGGGVESPRVATPSTSQTSAASGPRLSKSPMPFKLVEIFVWDISSRSGAGVESPRGATPSTSQTSAASGPRQSKPQGAKPKKKKKNANKW